MINNQSASTVHNSLPITHYTSPLHTNFKKKNTFFLAFSKYLSNFATQLQPKYGLNATENGEKRNA